MWSQPCNHIEVAATGSVAQGVKCFMCFVECSVLYFTEEKPKYDIVIGFKESTLDTEKHCNGEV